MGKQPAPIGVLAKKITPHFLEKCLETVKKFHDLAGVSPRALEVYDSHCPQRFATLAKILLDQEFHPISFENFPHKASDLPQDQLIPFVDRSVVQEALRRLLLAPCDRLLTKEEQEREKAGRGQPEKKWQTLDIDVPRLLHHVPSSLPLGLLKTVVNDRAILALVREFLKAGLFKSEDLPLARHGEKQGGCLVPLLSNLVLEHLKTKFEARGCRAARPEAAHFLLQVPLVPGMEAPPKPQKEKMPLFEGGTTSLGPTPATPTEPAEQGTRPAVGFKQVGSMEEILAHTQKAQEPSQEAKKGGMQRALDLLNEALEEFSDDSNPAK